MNTKEKFGKRIYISPEIVSIELDNDISLALESNPPLGPEESMNHYDNFNSDPLKTQLG